MESAHQLSFRPDCNNTAEVPSFTLRTALSAIPFCNRSLLQLMTGITFDIGSPRSVVTFVTVDMLSCRPFFFNMATVLLSSFVLDLLLGCSST